MEVFSDTFPASNNFQSEGFVQDPSGEIYWGAGLGTDDNVIVTFDEATGRLAFDNSVDPDLKLLAFGAGQKDWGPNTSNVDYDILAPATANPSDKTPQRGITSDSPTDATFYEAALWSVRNGPGPVDPSVTVQELFAVWRNTDNTPQTTRFALDDQSIAITDDPAAYQQDINSNPEVVLARIVLRPVA